MEITEEESNKIEYFWDIYVNPALREIDHLVDSCRSLNLWRSVNLFILSLIDGVGHAMRGEVGRGSEGLREFISTYLSQEDPRYVYCSRMIEKIFRHGLAHGGLPKRGSAVSREREDRHLSLLSIGSEGWVLVLDVEILRSHLKGAIINYKRDLRKTDRIGKDKRTKLLKYLEELENRAERTFQEEFKNLVDSSYGTESTAEAPERTTIFPVQVP